MKILSELILCQAAPAEGIPLGAIVFLSAFVLLIALFVFAWVRKRRRGDEVDELPAKPAKAPEKKEIEQPIAEALEKPEPAEPEKPEPEVPEKPVFELGEARSMREGLAKTHEEGFVSRLGKLFRGKQIDESILDDVEEVMFTSDIGVNTSQRLLEGMRGALGRKELGDSESVWRYLRDETRTILDKAKDGSPSVRPQGAGPEVIMVIGVNGSGKTTTIGKLAARYKAEGRRVLLAAGDTFRAAAVEQLEVWARRVGVEVHSGREGADPASVVFDAIEHATAEGHDLVIADTAGRLHTQKNLMGELVKVHRVIGKAREGGPHEVLLVLDATTGQNAIQQAQIFGEAVNVTGIVLTKLDGTAKGGVIIGICDHLGTPIRFVGVGERVQDMRPFDSGEFVEALYDF